jgi:hypothetical protein
MSGDEDLHDHGTPWDGVLWLSIIQEEHAMKKGVTLLVVMSVVISAAGCGMMARSHVGKTFDYTWSNACTWDRLPASCSIPSEHFTFNFDVEQLATGDYTINGYAMVNPGAQRTPAEYKRATFTFLLGEDGTIHDAVYHYAYAGDLWSNIPLDAQFSSKREFDALFVNYEVECPCPEESGTAHFYERRLEPQAVMSSF